jgi:hypothetical protein
MKNSNSEPVGDETQRSSQRQKPAPLPFPESEWAFHKVKKRDDLRYCAMWELARLRGDKQKPWLDLTPEAQARFILREQYSLLEIPAKAVPLGQKTRTY